MNERIEILKEDIRGLRALGYDSPLTATADEQLSLTSRIAELGRLYDTAHAEGGLETSR